MTNLGPISASTGGELYESVGVETPILLSYTHKNEWNTHGGLPTRCQRSAMGVSLIFVGVRQQNGCFDTHTFIQFSTYECVLLVVVQPLVRIYCVPRSSFFAFFRTEYPLHSKVTNLPACSDDYVYKNKWLSNGRYSFYRFVCVIRVYIWNVSLHMRKRFHSTPNVSSHIWKDKLKWAESGFTSVTYCILYCSLCARRISVVAKA